MNQQMISTTLGELARADVGLAEVGSLKLSPKHAYHLKKLRALVVAELKHYHEERERYVKELGTERVGGGFEIKPDTPQMAEFMKRFDELANIAVVLPWGPITLQMLGDQLVSEQALTSLGALFAEPEHEEAP
jgi:hypothetical protein